MTFMIGGRKNVTHRVSHLPGWVVDGSLVRQQKQDHLSQGLSEPMDVTTTKSWLDKKRGRGGKLDGFKLAAG